MICSKFRPESVLVFGGGADAESVEADVPGAVGELGRTGGEPHGGQLDYYTVCMKKK